MNIPLATKDPSTITPYTVFIASTSVYSELQTYQAWVCIEAWLGEVDSNSPVDICTLSCSLMELLLWSGACLPED